MKFDLIIKGGYLVDARQQINSPCDVAVLDGKVAALGDDLTQADTVLDARGCIVSPGLIDNHLHMFADATDAGIDPNVGLLPNGVTTAAEGGSAGVSTYEIYRKTILNNSRVRIKSYLSAAPTGMITRQYPENFDPAYFDKKRIKELFQKYPDELLGLKIRYGKAIIRDLGAGPLEAVLKMADEIGCRVTVHITDPAIDIEELASMLRPGDVFCHAFQGHGQTILDENGKVLPKIREAKRRGVIIDACNGAYNFSAEVAQKALADGFFPDIISTDYNTMVMFRHPVISLPYLMSKYLALGMRLEDVFAACTKAPADAIGMPGEVGSLCPSMPADIAVFRLEECPSTFYDCHGVQMTGKQLIVPQLTVKGGRILYRQTTFNAEIR